MERNTIQSLLWVGLILCLFAGIAQLLFPDHRALRLLNIGFWVGVILIGAGVCLVVYLLLIDNVSALKYFEQIFPYHIRALGLVVCLGGLIYFAFFFNKETLIESVRIELASQEAKLSSLERAADGMRRILVQLEGSETSKGGASTATRPGDGRAFVISEPAALQGIERDIESTMKQVVFLRGRLEANERSEHNSNMLFAIRALCLGGIGALVTLLARRTIAITAPESEFTFFQMPKYWTLLITHIILGGLISLVAFALFYTKQITIFKPDTSPSTMPSGDPEFWRVTLLCIVAGAFAEKIYGAVSSKIEKYVDDTSGKEKSK